MLDYAKIAPAALLLGVLIAVSPMPDYAHRPGLGEHSKLLAAAAKPTSISETSVIPFVPLQHLRDLAYYVSHLSEADINQTMPAPFLGSDEGSGSVSNSVEPTAQAAALGALTASPLYELEANFVSMNGNIPTVPGCNQNPSGQPRSFFDGFGDGLVDSGCTGHFFKRGVFQEFGGFLRMHSDDGVSAGGFRGHNLVYETTFKDGQGNFGAGADFQLELPPGDPGDASYGVYFIDMMTPPFLPALSMQVVGRPGGVLVLVAGNNSGATPVFRATPIHPPLVNSVFFGAIFDDATNTLTPFYSPDFGTTRYNWLNPDGSVFTVPLFTHSPEAQFQIFASAKETQEQSLGEKASDLAKEVIGSDYLWGGKGWDYASKTFVAPATIQNGFYRYWHPKINELGEEDPAGNKFDNGGKGLDCSGLIRWAFNRSHDPSDPSGILPELSADGMYRPSNGYTDSVASGAQQPGDLMFFDADNDGYIEHVALYSGPFNHEGAVYDMVEARSRETGVTVATVSARSDPNADGFVGFRRINNPLVNKFSVKTKSPIGLIVMDPTGITITPETFIRTEQELNREVPGELYYSVYDSDSDGSPRTEIFSPHLKNGDYFIVPVRRDDAPSGAVFSIEVTTDTGTTILAQNVPVDQIPSEGYGVTVSDSSSPIVFTPVSIDIKPDSAENTVNLGSKGNLPVVIFGSATLDVGHINPSSVRLANAPIQQKGKNQIMVSYSDVNGDEFLDFLAQIPIRSMQLTQSDTRTELTGELLNGTIIKGSDSIRVVP